MRLPEFHSLRARIVLFFAWLLATVLAIVFALVTTASYQIARQQSRDDLRVGRRVFNHLVDQNHERLIQSANVLTSDFGLRAAVASRDVPTIASALQNHQRRIGSDIALLSDVDGTPVADTLDGPQPGGPELAPVLREAELRGSATGILVVGARAYDIVTVPVLAPQPLGWLTLGFRVDDDFTRELAALTSLEISFLHLDAGRWRVLASTRGHAEQDALLGAVADAGPLLEPQSATLPGYETELVAAGNPQGATAVALQSSTARAVARFDELRATLLVLSALGIGGALVGSIVIAGRITRPIQALAARARRMQEGHYVDAVEDFGADEIGKFAETFEHMRAAIVARESEIRRLAFVDVLTGLPNRMAFQEDLAQRLAASPAPRLAVLMIDLDRFKDVNDTLGHAAGDAVLRVAAQRLAGVLRGYDRVYRFGGDEFALLIAAKDAAEAEAVVSRIRLTIEEDVSIDGEPVDVGCSIGIALCPDHGTEASLLVRRADIATHESKRSRAGATIYDPARDDVRRERLNLLGELRRAVQGEQLTAFYQPKCALPDGRVVGAEALVRWQHPARGLVPPGEFIPFAEQTGAIRLVTRWMIAQAARQCGAWLAAGHELEVSLNVSARDLLDRDLVDAVREAIAANGIPPRLLCLEITESSLMEDPRTAHETVSRLHALGVQLAIDDYGTGYSSLAYVKRLPVSELKIDRAFVMNMTKHPEDAAIVRSTIELGHNLRLRVVAEGVETEAEIELLTALGCDVVQGYLVSRPLPAAQFDAWLAQDGARKRFTAPATNVRPIA
ncbi:MAG: EAL domain-containing protein [Gammaproteobacteria bacterium]|nr:EAL domain-containing protein [Gammaproteobacteria bacterium]